MHCIDIFAKALVLSQIICPQIKDRLQITLFPTRFEFQAQSQYHSPWSYTTKYQICLQICPEEEIIPRSSFKPMDKDNGSKSDGIGSMKTPGGEQFSNVDLTTAL